MYYPEHEKRLRIEQIALHAKMLSAALLAVLTWSFPEIALSADQSPEELLRECCQRHFEDWERWKVCRGRGELVWIGPDGKSNTIHDSEFELRDTALWQALVTRSAEPVTTRAFDRVELIADGTSILSVRIDDRLKPNGCQFAIRNDDDTMLFITTAGHFDLREQLIPFFVRHGESVIDAQRVGEGSFEFESLTADTAIVLVKFQGSYYRYVLSAEWDWRVVKFELFAGLAKAFWIYEYEWKRQDNVIHPGTATVQVINAWGDSKAYHTYIFSFRDLEQGPSDREFTLAALQKACPGGRLIDHRPNVDTPVRNVVTTTKAAETLSDAVEQLPNRYPQKVESPAPERSNATAIIITLNLTIIVMIASVWLFRRHARKRN